MSLGFVLSFIQQKRGVLSKDADSVNVLSKQSPATIVSEDISTKASDAVWDRIKTGPMAQLGKDFVSEQIAKNGATIINNVDKAIGNTIRKPIQDAQNLVFDSIGAALTAKNDLAMFFLQELAKRCIVEIGKKRAVLLVLQEKLRLLYNALVILVAGSPFFNRYLTQLRRALIIIYESRNETVVVRNTLDARDVWLKRRFENVKDNLKAAEALMQPVGPEPDVKFTDKGLLANVGVPSEPQQLTLLLSIPQLVQEVLAAANGYFVATVKLNALLLAFCAGAGTLQTSSSKKMKEYSLSTLDNLIKQMDDLISSMANGVNGDPGSIAIPNSGYTPDSVKVSSASLGWILQLKTIIEYATFVPGNTLQTLQISNNALGKYNAAVTGIKSKGNRTNGQAILTATEGREEYGQLERQLTTFSLACLKAIVDGKASASVLSLGRTLQQRLELSLTQDKEIEVLLQAFATADLGFDDALKRTGNGIYKMLDNLGLDRASQLLKDGDFTNFFNLNSKTATFAGAALVGLSVLKECLHTEEDREQLTQAEREIQREVKAKELLAQRASATGFEQQKTELAKEDKRLYTLEDRSIKAADKCQAFVDEFRPSNMFKNIGPVIGVGAFGGSTLSAGLKKLGKGIL